MTVEESIGKQRLGGGLVLAFLRRLRAAPGDIPGMILKGVVQPHKALNTAAVAIAYSSCYRESSAFALNYAGEIMGGSIV